MTEYHAPLPPSDAARWGAPEGCRGSPAMQRKYPQSDDDETSREGTAAHWYLAETLQGRHVTVGNVAPNGVMIDSEMIDSAQEILLDLRAIVANAPGNVLRVEERVQAHETIHPDNDGTPDVYLLDMVTQTLWLRDYKYGHRWVDVYRNMQLIDYAIAIFESNGFNPLALHGEPGCIYAWRIELGIAQPRSFGPGGTFRTWSLGGAALRDHALQLRKAAIEASQPDAPLRAGDHCRDCSAIVPCPANQIMVSNALDVIYRQTGSDMDDIQLGYHGLLLERAAERVKHRLVGIDAEALARIKSGRRIPYTSLEPTTGRERWTLPVEEIVPMLMALENIDISVPKALTPAQARKARIDETVIKAYSERPSGAMKLVRTTTDDTTRLIGSR